MPVPFDLEPFLGEPVPVVLVDRLLSFEVEGWVVNLHCSRQRYDPYLYSYYGTECETVFEPPQTAAPGLVRLEFCTAEIVRVGFFPDLNGECPLTPMVVGEFDPRFTLEIIENDQTVSLLTPSIRVEVTREPFRLALYDRSGRLVWATRPVDLEPLRRPAEQWNPAQERWLFLHRYAYPPGSYQGDRQIAFASFDLHHDEHIFGLGEDFGPVDKRGVQRRLWLQEGFGNASPAAYKQAPFYMSTRGYGLFVNTSHGITFHVGDRDHTALSIILEDSAALDLYLIFGPELAKILPRYTSITGQPAVPPRWSFGLWMSRISYRNQQQVETVAADLRAHQIPCDVIHIDTDWYERDWECDLEFGPLKFPDPAQMSARLREAGFRISLWQWPNMVVTSKMFSEGEALGALVKRPNGEVYLQSGFGPDAGLIDYSNPAAVALVKGKITELFKLGIATIKTDFGEGAPHTGRYHSLDGSEAHNLYPLLYNRAIFEAVQEFWGEDQGVVWSRSAWAGSQRYPVHWSGDGVARFEDLACVLRSALSFGLSGFPFYSHDIGGFSGLPSPELYIRWAQLGFFSSHTRCHGVPPREPWAYGERAESIFRQFCELRYRLISYIFSEAVRCGASSLPMVRPLVLSFQGDPTTLFLDDQYLFGADLLIAPILDETGRRQVYLPAGTWTDFWRKKTHQGPSWLTVETPLEEMPIFVRPGAILPLGPVMQHTGEQPVDPLTVEIYQPAGQASTKVYFNDGLEVAIRYVCLDGVLEVHLSPAPGQVELVVYGVEVDIAKLNQKIVPVEKTPTGGIGVRFDGRSPVSMTFFINPAIHLSE